MHDLNSFDEKQTNTDCIINAKLKITELFLTWLSHPDTSHYINDLLDGINNDFNILETNVKVPGTDGSNLNGDNSGSMDSSPTSTTPIHDTASTTTDIDDQQDDILPTTPIITISSHHTNGIKIPESNINSNNNEDKMEIETISSVQESSPISNDINNNNNNNQHNHHISSFNHK